MRAAANEVILSATCLGSAGGGGPLHVMKRRSSEELSDMKYMRDPFVSPFSRSSATFVPSIIEAREHSRGRR